MSEATTLMTDAAPSTQGTASQSSTDTTAASAPPQGTTAPDGQQQQSTQDQTTQSADKTAEGDASKGEQADQGEKPGAPEKYEFVMPEGVQMDEAGIEAFSEFAKEVNLSQEDAQKFLDKLGPAMQNRQAEALKQLNQTWTETSKADKEFGGEKLSENLAVAKKAMDAFGTPELRTLLNDSGLGNHPEIIRAFYRAGKSISEDRVVPAGTGGQRGSFDPAKSLYPNQ